MAVRVRFPSRAPRSVFTVYRIMSLTSRNASYFRGMNMRILMFFMFAVALLAACGKGKVRGRFISETDTAFTADIRDVSAKINKDPYNAELYYRRGNAFFYQNRFSDAVTDFGTAVEIDSLNAMYHFRLGESVLKLDTADSRKAFRHLKRATELKPDFDEAQMALSRLYVVRQEYDKASGILEKLKEKTEYADKAWVLLGITYRERKDTSRAMQAFENALQANPQNYDAVMQLAEVYRNRGKELCIQYYDRAIAINEFSDEAHYGKGFFRQKQGRYADAVALYDQARTLNPGHILALYNTAYIQSLFEEWEKCEQLCSRLLEMKPDHANALALRGYSHEKRGNKKAALEDYRAALDIDPQNKPARVGLDVLQK